MLNGTEAEHGRVEDLRPYHEAVPALQRIGEIYNASADTIRSQFESFSEGSTAFDSRPACYPYVGISIPQDAVNLAGQLAYGKLPGAGVFGTTVTRPDLFRSYYLGATRALDPQPSAAGLDRPKQTGSSR